MFRMTLAIAVEFFVSLLLYYAIDFNQKTLFLTLTPYLLMFGAVVSAPPGLRAQPYIQRGSHYIFAGCVIIFLVAGPQNFGAYILAVLITLSQNVFAFGACLVAVVTRTTGLPK